MQINLFKTFQLSVALTASVTAVSLSDYDKEMKQLAQTELELDAMDKYFSNSYDNEYEHGLSQTYG